MDNKKQSESEPHVIMPYGYMPYCLPEEEKIDLRELWKILKRRKKTIFLTSGILFLIALVYLIFSTSFFEAKATIEMGKELVKKNDGALITKYFDDSKNLKQYLDVKYDTAGKYREKNATSFIDSVTIPKKSEGFLIISALGPDNEQAIKTLKVTIDDIVSKHRVYYDSIIQHKKDTIETLDKEMNYRLDVELPQLKKNLELLKTVELKKIEERINLVKILDIKKIEEKINFFKKLKIPAIQKKIEENRKEISNRQASIEEMMASLKGVAEKDPALATMTAMQIANLQNDIARLKMQIIDHESEIKKIEEETIPDLMKQKERIAKETLFNLESQKRRLLEEVIPAKQAQIEKLTKITIPQLETRISQVKTSMKEPYLVMTHIVGKIYTHDYPIKPKKKLVLAVALITGLMLGVFLAFFLEFISKEEK